MNSLPPSRPRRWKAIGLLVLVFVIGMIAGIGGLALVVRQSIQQNIASGAAGNRLINRLQNETISKLKLTPGEQAAIAPEFEITRSEVRMHRLRMLDALRSTSEDTLRRVKAKLPQEKQILLEDAARKRLGPWGLLGDSED